jgi:GNAT superfamily N-acetyltransferase
MACPSIVRVARPADHTEIWRLFLQGHKENGKFAVAPEKVDWFLARALHPEQIPDWDTGPRPTVGVIGDVGDLEALVFVAIGTYWYSHDRHLEEFIVYVDPECRQSGHARALISWMKLQSDRSGLPLITGIMSNHRTEAKVRLYSRMLQPIGAFFTYGGKGTTSASSAAFA